MKKLKNKARLTTAVIAFTLVFLVGAAFAATDGILQFAGGIGIGEPTLHVAWDGTSTPTATPANAVTTNVARVVDFFSLPGAPGSPIPPTFVDGHRIEWAIGFVDAGSVTLVGTAENIGQEDADILPPNVAWWEDDDAEFSTDLFTVSSAVVDGSDSSIALAFPYRLNVGETVDIAVTVVWNGDAPTGGFGAVPAIMPFSGSTLTNWTTDNWLGNFPGDYSGGQLYGYDWANNFMISLVYVLAQ